MAQTKEERAAYNKQYHLKNLEKENKRSREYHATHKKEDLLRNKQYRINNPEKSGKWYRKYQLKIKHGITEDMYIKLYTEQNGRCAICNTHQDDITMPFHIDHDHTTGKIRGLLCNRCNMALGLLKDNSDIFQSAIDYILKNK
jgi:hypothetical protein